MTYFTRRRFLERLGMAGGDFAVNAAPPIMPEQIAQARESLPAEGPLMFAN